VTSFTLAHLSDPHLPLPGAPWREFLNKRVTGLLSWSKNRRKIHLPRILDLLLADLKAVETNHIAVTGDLINLSLPEEFVAASRWLQLLGPADRVSVVPGNHDLYVPTDWAGGLALWAANMRGERASGEAPRQPENADDFPFVRRSGQITIIGTSTAVPMPPFVAAGRLGAGQCRRLESILAGLGREDLFRVVLIHHPPLLGGVPRRKALLDANVFQDVIRSAGAELVLHGHTHLSGLSRIRTETGDVPVIGVPSASASPTRSKDPARYHLYRIKREPGSWSLEVEIRGLTEDRASFARQGTLILQVPFARNSTGHPAAA
jgi:3',5'-cyclic AMP phosphodiesterase CpdA